MQGDLYLIIKEQREEMGRHPGVTIELNKRNMIFDIVSLIKLGVITMENLDGVSVELKERVEFLLGRE